MAGWIGAVIASAVLNGICQGVIVVALVWLALRTIPGIAAATRCAIWMLTLVLVTALPLVEFLLPAVAGPGGQRAAALADGGAAAITLPVAAPWLLWVLAGWAAISLVLVIRVAWGYKILQGLKRRAVPLPREFQERFEALETACPGRRQARLLASDEIASPLAAGLFRPAVLVPGFLVDRLSGTELGDVLTHELAHLRRWDDCTNLVQRLVEALAFFHPAVFWIGRRLSLEREIACDDWVVARTGTPRPYAACLAKLAALIPAVSPQLAPGLASPKPQVSIRVEALLRKTRNGKARASKAALALASTVLLLGGTAALPVAPVRIVNPGDTSAQAGRLNVLRSQPGGSPNSRRMMAAPPAIAYASKSAPAAAARSFAKVRRHSRTVSGTPGLQASRGRVPGISEVRPTPALAQDEVVAAAWQEPVAACFVVFVSGDQGGWIRIIWFHAARAAVLNPA
jgi:beta-lactamase regulating signal transducer with metallopeptidase domain